VNGKLAAREGAPLQPISGDKDVSIERTQ